MGIPEVHLHDPPFELEGLLERLLELPQAGREEVPLSIQHLQGAAPAADRDEAHPTRALLEGVLDRADNPVRGLFTGHEGNAYEDERPNANAGAS